MSANKRKGKVDFMIPKEKRIKKDTNRACDKDAKQKDKVMFFEPSIIGQSNTEGCEFIMVF